MSISCDQNSSTRMGRPADLAKREAILDASTASFFANGFAATSIEQVAADAGVSKVTVYNHFGDKRGLFTATVERECERIGGLISIEIANNGTLEQRLTHIGEEMSAFLSRREMVQFERRIAAETENEPSIGIAFLDAGPRRMKAQLSALLQQIVDDGELEIEDTTLATEQFVSMCKGLGDLERRFGAAKDEARDEDRIKGAVSVFLKAYRRTP